MATVRVSGTRVVTPQGPTTIAAPGGNINLSATNTNITGNTNIAGNTFITGVGRITNPTQTIGTDSGALQVVGGVWVGKDLRVDNDVWIGSSTYILNTLTVYNSATITGSIEVYGSTSTVIIHANDDNVGNPANIAYTNTNIYGNVEDRLQGAVYVAGGVGIEKDLNVGGFIYGRVSEANTSLQFIVTSTNADATFYPTFALYPYTAGSTATGVSYNYIDTTNTGTTASGGLTYNPYLGKLTTERIWVSSTSSSTNPVTGAFTVTGGVGILGDVHIGGTEYVDEIYTKFIRSTEGPISIQPEGNLTEITGDIRVLGKRPIGTAPVVTNTLYVTMDGDDTNDGRAQDPSRACRTIGGAMQSPYYQPGTQIRVSAGHYFEDNPLSMKPYTSVMGSDIRTTEIEPINKTQDLFHVNSGCYLAFMQFCQGRSGLLEGPYRPEYNRGAYATAFPPLTGNDRIDLFHSPYIQNCTNLSGPWLKDGVLFQPSSTVQIPLAVGSGTWPANTTSITVNVSTGTITKGMYINAGQTNPEFFNARTLLLANKPFLQAQVVSYVDATFNSGAFTYNEADCYRDTGLIIDSIALDMLQRSTSDSTFAGLQYWSQTAEYVGTVNTEITTTTNAINHALELAVAIVEPISTTASNIVSNNFNEILSILNAGTVGVSDIIVANGLESTNQEIIDSYDALIAAKDDIALQTIQWINENNPFFTYSTSTCFRDIGFIIDSVAFDLLHGGNKQSIKSGVYYYGYDAAASAVDNQIPLVTAAYNYIRDILNSIVTGQRLSTNYSTSTQITSLTPGTSYEVEVLQDKIDVITNIIRNGPSVAGPQVPINQTQATAIQVLNAYNILIANRTFIQAEVIAYINSQFNSFTYSREFCYRDVGILVENAAYDAVFGGNEKSVQSGLAYYNGVVSRISGQETQTISAIDYLAELCKKVVKNEVCPVLPPVGTIPQADQVRNTVLLGGEIILDSLEKCFNVVTEIIRKGPDTAPAILIGSNPDAAYVSAEILMQANRKFIQQDTINWINNTFRLFNYSTVKCERDIGLVIDSIIGDLLFPTNEHSQSTFAGLQYYAQEGYVDNIGEQLNPTISAMEYLKDLSIKIIQNITPADDLVARYQTTATQITTLQAATVEEAVTIGRHFDNILSILNGKTTGWSDVIKFSYAESNFLSVRNAYELLQANKEYLASEIIAYVNTTNPGFSTEYSQAKCMRDVGFITDCVSFDLLHDSNKQSIQAGLYYYGFVADTSTIRNQEIQTTAAFDYLSDLVNDIVQNIPVLPLQSVIKQNLLLPASDSTVASALTVSVSTITNIITNGPSVAAPLVPISLTATNSVTATNAVVLLNANREFIKAEVITYIDNTYNSTPFVYDPADCYRDTGLIIESIATDMMQSSISDSTFAGLQYWNQGGLTGLLGIELTTTTNAINYARDLILTALTSYPSIITDTTTELFGTVTDILNNGTVGVTDIIESNDLASEDSDFVGAFNVMQSNKSAIQNSTIAWINSTYPTFAYNTATCYRDLGYIIDSVSFDLLHGGNKQSVKSGVYYYSYTNNTAVANEQEEVTAAYKFIANLVTYIVTANPVPRVFQTGTVQVTNLSPATDVEVAILQDKINVIVDIINQGPSIVGPKTPIELVQSTDENYLNAWELLVANKVFIQEEVIAFINKTFVVPKSFKYNEAKCYRDTGLIVDAVSQDILLGGNAKSIEAGLSYWNLGYNSVTGQETTTTMALNHARDIALKIIANEPVVPQPGTSIPQIINTFFQYGGDYMPQQAVRRNFSIITNIIERGPVYAPPLYAGSNLVSQTGLQSLDVKIAPRVSSVDLISTGTYLIGLNTSTIGFGTNASLYFGDIPIFPYQDSEVEALSLKYTGSTSTWDQRKVDPIGGMGGSLVDGAVISDRSPIQSFVYDAFTQLTQGGRGVRVTNNGYAQLVSVFTIFSSVGVQVDNGGIASIVNSNANFGDLCLVAKGFGTRKFTGTIYNPAFKAYPDSPGDTGLNQYYPNGFWPNNARVQVFVPDVTNKPHISQVLEVVPPDGHTNEQGLPGFLNAQPSLGVLTTGSITITGIVTDGIAIGNSLYIRDQFGSFTGTNGLYYSAVDTVVTDIGYQSVTLNNALPTGGGDIDNDRFFNLYFCGNAYYTVFSSVIATNPKPEGINILSAEGTGGNDQIQAHADALDYLNTLVNNIIGNTPVASLQTTATSAQTFLPAVTGGRQAREFIDLRFGEMIDIITSPNLTAAEDVIPPAIRTKTGTVPAGAGSAVTLIRANIDFLADEIVEFVNRNDDAFTYDETLCRRDLGYILEGTYYDIAFGTNYNAVTSGLAYARSVSTVVTSTELVQTIRALDFAQAQSEQAVNNSATAMNRSNSGFEEIKNILANGAGVASAITFPIPTNASANTASALSRLVLNKEFMKVEIIAWLTDNYPSLSYDPTLCARDVGYVIDALCYDVLYGGNTASIIAARAYFQGTELVIAAGEIIATTNAYNRLSEIAQQIVKGETVVVSTNNTDSQIFAGDDASATEASIINDLLLIITDVVSTGDINNLPGTNYPSITWASADIQEADAYLANVTSTIIDETITYIDNTFLGTFNYDEAKCQRDTGLIVDAIVQDLLFNGTSQSVFSGIQYWNQGSYVGDISNELTTTTNAISYVSALAQKIIVNDISGPRYQSTVAQNTGTAAATGAEVTILQDDFNVILDIIADGTVGVTDIIVPNDIVPSTDGDVLNAYTILQANKEYIKAEAVAYVEATKDVGFVYDQTKCARDVGYMVDSVSIDLLYGGNRQAVQSGVYYYGYDDSSSSITGEIPQTTAAYNHIRRMIERIVTGQAVAQTYQDIVPQQIGGYTPGTTAEVAILQGNVDVITNIINNGPSEVTAKTPIGINRSSSTNVNNAATILAANRSFIQAEVIAFIEYTFNRTFTYDSVKCKRDVKITLERLIYDLESGGRYNSVMTGLSYWSRTGTHRIVTLGENVRRNDLFPDGSTVNFYQRSYISASGYVFEYVGAGTNYAALPQFAVADPVQGKEVVQLGSGKVFFTSTDQNGDFRIGPGLVISQATGVLSGRTFTKSLFANMTPFILAIEAGGI